MKFSVKSTLKASALGILSGTIGPGIYDTESPNFPEELKAVLIAEVEDSRGLVVCLDPRDYNNIPEPEVAAVSVASESLDEVSSGEGEAEESGDAHPPLGTQADATTAAETVPSPTKITKPRRISAKK